MAEDKYREALSRSAVTIDDEFVAAEVKRIIDENREKYSTEEVYKFLFNCIDLTTLQSTDSPRSVADFTEKVNQFETEHPENSSSIVTAERLSASRYLSSAIA